MRAPTLAKGAATAGAIVLLGLFAASRRGSGAPDVGVTASSSGAGSDVRAPAIRLAWTPGMRHRYSFALASATHTHAPGLGEDGELSGELTLSGALELRTLGTNGGRSILALAVPRVGAHAWKVLGGDLLADDVSTRAVFDGQEAFVELAASGKPERILFKRDAPELWKSVTQTLVAAMTVTVPEDAAETWTASETTPTGVARVAYDTTSKGPRVLERRRIDYETIHALLGCQGCGQTLDARSRISLDPKGHVASIHDAESLVVARAPGAQTALRATSSFDLTLVETTLFEAPTTVTLDPSLEARAAGALRQGAAPERELLARRVADLTFEELEHTLASYDGKELPNGFVTQASGLLLQEPALAKKLVPFFTAAKTTDAQRAVVMDLLASASNKEAQAAMCDALSSDVGKASALYPSLLQRLSFVPTPTPETLRFVEQAYTAGRAGSEAARLASAYTAGAAAFSARREGETARADAMAARLRADLAAAKTPKETSAMLTALGAAAAPGDGQRIVGFARGKDARVRASAAGALRRFKEPEVRRALTDMLGDPAAEVEEAALRSLDAQPITGEELTRVATALTSGQTSPGLDGSLVSFLGKHAGMGGPVARMLEFLLSRASRPEDSARVRFVLEQLRDRNGTL